MIRIKGVLRSPKKNQSHIQRRPYERGRVTKETKLIRSVWKVKIATFVTHSKSPFVLVNGFCGI